MAIDHHIKAFIQALSVENGYSVHTCRAYRKDLESFVSYIQDSRSQEIHPRKDEDGAAKASFNADPQGEDEKNAISVAAEDVDSLTIRGYLGFLHQKNQGKR